MRSLSIAESRHGLMLRGVIAFATRDFDFAAQIFRRLCNLKSDDFEALANLGSVEYANGRYSAAYDFFRRSVALFPEGQSANLSLAIYEFSFGAISKSLASFARCRRLEEADAKVRLNQGLAWLCVGGFGLGWALYEARFEIDAYEDWLCGSLWRNSTSACCRVLVWGEQGVGDEVMFGSMLGEFRGHVGKLLVQLDRRLIPLFKRSLPDDVEFFERGTVVPEDRYDSHIAIGSLGQYLRPTLESFEGKGGKYLWADPERIQAMREWLSVKEGERVIGLSWRSSNPETGAARSLALKDLVKSLQAPGARFVNLQYGDVSAEIEALEQDEGIQVLECPGLDTTDDLDGLAALIEACDEVVSIGNATAHLAGALGKKTTVLLPKARSWRWLSETRDTPWYQAATLIRKEVDQQPWSIFLRSLAVRS
jgi:hypothetical protein